MSYQSIQTLRHDNILELRLNRPERLNAVIKPLYDELLDALETAERDPTIRVLMLSGEGRAFCVGADMKAHASGERSAFEKRQYLAAEQQLCKRLFSLEKPIVCVVQGYAIGAGAELAIACDFLLMSKKAQLGLPEVSIGTFIGGAVSYLLPRLVGLARARELIFGGQRISAKRALKLGLASRCLDEECFREQALEYAQALAQKAPLSMALAKRHLNLLGNQSIDAALASELEGMCFCATTHDWQEGVDAFAEKRPPRFTGN
ncbi:enoyl-CoA hydratase/isomerase family protein [Aestuariirhabdus litorea]|uniref:Enoyl-CoA hydratase/isomerase family protein n=1 Tax=Aestuariirhabdus litorea TaxID=2528527 RepID=A0A3P3VNC0_9GAMM|nr:enoyl-CoA hydratase/isomerase family protein [Aestuariirhabdus litorea]RRJ84110.1 enoyl-CoA hydratase/isomerase family protein [Aestuariirhabdus litorea]RWW97330.1 enoyl-CoA hydratase/isomerase family protein [Endozoicomonadaceae bacterium GTF-13]